MTTLLPLLLLAAAASASLEPLALAGGVALTLLLLAGSANPLRMPAEVMTGHGIGSDTPAPMPTPAGETRLASIYERKGRLVYRRAAK